MHLKIVLYNHMHKNFTDLKSFLELGLEQFGGTVAPVAGALIHRMFPSLFRDSSSGGVRVR